MPEHEYQGIMFPGEISKETLDAIPDYPVRDDDIFIVTYPKTGTNWMMEIVSKVMKAAGKMATPEEHSMWCFELQMPGLDEKPRHELIKDAPSPRIIHTHLQRQLAPKMVANPTGKIKVIVVMRNPKDTAVSFYHYEKKMFKEYSRPGDVVPKRYESWEAYADNFLKGKVIFGDFYDHVLGWWQMKDDRHFLFLKYEDMKKDLRSVVSEVASFLETSLDDAAVTNIADSCTFNTLKAAWSNSGSVMKENICRKGVIGDWKSMFTPEKNEAYDDKHKLRLAGTGLEFDFE
ncbi:PREDICTED: sulfotransferase 6B1-like [Branchiostoma belcheri]|uniref:Sulfotransferase n=1 Tax=Branchiostoma belcheri TaxID=7741 RepID=A0A6P4YS23_BRABE|nr:PREDICTED: sulfotransferase 6B1-like [Branchiostoma belcheri]XP_019632270.1 PREDICTED: sulfotransferase 6B1-like [Branchiostoma belcheri]